MATGAAPGRYLGGACQSVIYWLPSNPLGVTTTNDFVWSGTTRIIHYGAQATVVDATRWSEDDLEPAIDAGAEDIVADGDIYEIVSEPGDLGRVRAALQAAGVEIEQAEVVQRPTSQVPVEEADAARLLRLIDDLEADDDVNAVHANFDAAAEVLERAAAAR